MDVKTEIVALAVRLLSDKTNLIRKPDTFETFLTSFMGEETYDRRLAKEIVADAAKLADTAKRFHLNRKFKKITRHI